MAVLRVVDLAGYLVDLKAVMWALKKVDHLDHLLAVPKVVQMADYLADH